MWPQERPQMELIATREFFPARFRDAVRQRSRWVLGIAFQGWENLGWGHSLRIRYTLFRDRKGLFSGYLNIVSYSLMAVFLSIAAFNVYTGHAWNDHLPQVAMQSRFWFWITTANLAMQVNRMVQKMICVARVARFRQVWIVPVRMMWAICVDLCSTMHATHRFAKSKLTGTPLKWAKTAHEYPSEEVICLQHRRLGELLLEKRFITPSQLLSALETQRREHHSLGQVLIAMNALTEIELQSTLTEQYLPIVV
jgi:adsorption protein B